MDLQQKILNMQTPASHKNDPQSSYDAEESITKSGKRREQHIQTFRAVKEYPNMTSAELAFMTGLDRAMLARRLPELTPHVVKSGSRLCDVNETNAVTWCIA